MNEPRAPPSSAAPANALSTQWAMNMPRTPSCLYCLIPRSTSALVQFGLSMNSLQLKRSDDSIPMITASLPCLITCLASLGLRTIRNQPLPGPPLCAST